MKNVILGWGLLGSALISVLLWCLATNTYPEAWAILALGLLVTAVRIGGEMPLLVAYVPAFLLLSNSSIPTRFMLIGLVAAGVSLILWRRFGQVSDAKFWTATMMILALPVATFSGASGGAGGWAEWLTEVFRLEGATAEQVIWWVRKSLHFTVYGVLALSAFKALDSNDHATSVTCGTVVIWSLSHACFDELKQMSIPGRTGSAVDIIIDLGGALVAVGFALHLKRKETS